MIISLAIVLVALFGVSVASEQALPGDTLYPMKVNITEKVEEAAHFSHEGKANFLADRLEERLAEAQKVSADVHEESKTDLDQGYSNSAKGVGEYILKLEKEGDYKTAAQLSLRARAALSHGAPYVDERSLSALKAKISTDENTFGKVSILLQSKVEEGNAQNKNGEDKKIDTSEKGDHGANVETGVKQGLEIKGGKGGIKESTEGGVKVKIGI